MMPPNTPQLVVVGYTEVDNRYIHLSPAYDGMTCSKVTLMTSPLCFRVRNNNILMLICNIIHQTNIVFGQCVSCIPFQGTQETSGKSV